MNESEGICRFARHTTLDLSQKAKRAEEKRGREEEGSVQFVVGELCRVSGRGKERARGLGRIGIEFACEGLLTSKHHIHNMLTSRF